MRMSKDDRKYRDNIYHEYAKNFQDSEKKFDANSAIKWGRAYDWNLRDWLPKNKTLKIGELACGNGKLLHFFKEREYINLSAVDISTSQVEIARQVIPDITLSNALEWLEDRESSFDLLISLDLVEHFNKNEALKFFELCYAGLKSGGRLILQTPNADSPFGLQHRYNDMTHEIAYNSNLITRLLIRAGFSHVECREQGPVPWKYSLSSTVRYIIWRFIRGVLQLWNITETGVKLPVLTRIFFICAVK